MPAAVRSERRERSADAVKTSPVSAVTPSGARFLLTADALEMIQVFGGTLHCYRGVGGCRKQGLYFSRTRPKKALDCRLLPADPDSDQGSAAPGARERQEIAVSVSADLASALDGAVLDFGNYNGVQRFVWTTLPGVKGPSCTCLRSVGPPAGKRSPCLDDRRIGLTDL
jgi:Fe-S cluster assembly iron-binding protein IscA